MSEQERTPEEAEQELVNAWVFWKEDTEMGTADPSVARTLIRKTAAPEPRPATSTPGAFFEVTGAEDELFRIVEGINRNDECLTANDSATLDLWQEMLEEWFARRDAKAEGRELGRRLNREDLVQSVARALHASIDEGLDWELLLDHVQSNYRNHARAVLAALATALGQAPAKAPTRLPASPFDLYELVRLEDAISNIDYPGADPEEWTHKAKVAARELERAARADERAPIQLILAAPPAGWFTFGSHVDRPDLELEFWGAEMSLDGLPIWERPRATADLSDDEWREFQAIPDQGRSHRAWVNRRIAERLAEQDQARAIPQLRPDAANVKPLCNVVVLPGVPALAGVGAIEACACVRPAGHDDRCQCTHEAPADALVDPAQLSDAAKIEAAARAIDPDPWTMSAAEFEAEYGGSPDWSEQSQAGRIEGSKTLAEQALEAAGAIGRG